MKKVLILEDRDKDSLENRVNEILSTWGMEVEVTDIKLTVSVQSEVEVFYAMIIYIKKKS